MSQFNKTKKILVLDVDQTLIQSEYIKGTSKEKVEQKFKKDLEKFENFRVCNNEYLTFVRPYIRDFIKFCFDHFNVIIWSSATPDYLQEILEYLVYPVSYPLEVLSRVDCISVNFNYLKELAYISNGYDVSLDDVVAVDDSVSCYSSGYANVLKIPAFSIYSNDTEKHKTILSIMQDKLLEIKDLPVTQVEKEEWSKTAFRSKKNVS